MSGDSELTTAVEDALRAPSVHNSQPWRWRIQPDGIQLHADPDRHLVATDPDRRDLILSCGAALHHLRVALAARGFGTEVHRLPDPEDSLHLATVVVRPGTGATDAAGDAALFPAIRQRRTDRRRLSRRPVTQEHIQVLVDRAVRAGGATLEWITEPATRQRLLDAIADAHHRQNQEPGYAGELRMWTTRLPAGRDGVPSANIAPWTDPDRATPLRRFGRAGLAQSPQQPGHGADEDASQLLVVTTDDDDTIDRLRAGEATSAVLLAATNLGLATTPLSQAIEVEVVRRRVRRDILHLLAHPQLIIRVGWPAPGAPPLPATPRRALRSVLLPSC